MCTSRQFVTTRHDFRADFLYGDGIGRYGACQLPDIAIKPTGILPPLPEFQALTGLVGHPADMLCRSRESVVGTRNSKTGVPARSPYLQPDRDLEQC